LGEAQHGDLKALLKPFPAEPDADLGSFSVNRWSLIQECILGITKLTYDFQPRTPTVKKLIGDILKPEADDLRGKLKALFAVPVKASLPFDRTPTAEELAIGEEIDKQEAEQLKQDFDR
jgi:hypothetical protein